MRKAAALILVIFASIETFLAVDYSIFLVTGKSIANLGPAIGNSSTQNVVQTVFWKNAYLLATGSWAILGVSFLRQGISQRWRSLGFEREVFNLMVAMKGAQSRWILLNYLYEPRHRSELSTLTGLDWKEVDREITILLRFGLVSLHVQSGSVKIYRLTDHGRLLLKLIDEVRKFPPIRSPLATSVNTTST